MIIKLKMVQLNEAVQFNGSTVLTMHSKDGVILYDTKNRLVHATPNKPTTIAKSVLVFPENIIFAAPEDDFNLEMIQTAPAKK